MPRRLHGFLQPEMVGESTAEAGTASLTTVNLVTITMPRVPAARWVIVRGAVRKLAGAAASVSIGLTLNSTQVLPNTAVTSAVNQAESGYFEFVIPPRVANYLRAGMGHHVVGGNGASAAVVYLNAASVDAPTVDLTQIIVTGLSGNAAVTLGIQNVQVFVL